MEACYGKQEFSAACQGFRFTACLWKAWGLVLYVNISAKHIILYIDISDCTNNSNKQLHSH